LHDQLFGPAAEGAIQQVGDKLPLRFLFGQACF